MQPTVRHSKKRDAILEALRHTTAHPTAETLYEELKPSVPDLSLGTVYRNLAQFKEQGLAISVGTVNGQERFDGCTTPHAHFICRECGAVIDLETSPEIHPVCPVGSVAEFATVVVTGLCADCAE